MSSESLLNPALYEGVAIVKIDKPLNKTRDRGNSENSQVSRLIQRYYDHKSGHEQEEIMMVQKMSECVQSGDYLGIGCEECLKLEETSQDTLIPPARVDYPSETHFPRQLKKAEAKTIAKPVKEIVSESLDRAKTSGAKTIGEISPISASPPLIPCSFNPVTERIKVTRKEPSRLSVKKQSDYKTRLALPSSSIFDRMTLNEMSDLLISRICYSNDGLLAFDKPYGLATIGGPKIKMSVAHVLAIIADRLKRSKLMEDIEFVHLLHRLDRSTSGLLLCACNRKAEDFVRKSFLEKRTTKEYVAITKGVPAPFEGEINVPLEEHKFVDNEKQQKWYKTMPVANLLSRYGTIDSDRKDSVRMASTSFKVVDDNRSAALLTLQLGSGIKHQIRSHLAYVLQCPVLGDGKYSHFAKLAPQKVGFEISSMLGIPQSKIRDLPVYLHARSIVIPTNTNRSIFIQAPIPSYFRLALSRLKLALK